MKGILKRTKYPYEITMRKRINCSISQWKNFLSFLKGKFPTKNSLPITIIPISHDCRYVSLPF